MTIKRFIIAVFAIALLIAAMVQVSKFWVRPEPMTLDFSDLTHADHFFIGAERSQAPIECPVTSLRDVNEIWEKELSPCTLGDGWLLPGPWGSHAFGTRSQILIEIADEAPRTLSMRIRAHGALPETDEQSIRILVNGSEIAKHPVSRKWRELRQTIPQGLLVVGRNEIVFEFAHTISERQAGISENNQAIAATINRLGLLALTEDAPPSAPEVVPTSVWDNQRQIFVIGASGTLVLPLLIPQDAQKIEFDLLPSRSVDPSTLSIELASENLDGRYGGRVSLAGRLVRDRGKIGLSVDDLAGQWALVTIEIAMDGGRLAVSPPRLLFDPAGRFGETMAGTSDVENGARPDIILITLDAARADRFSYAGHPRKTTPFIDALAEESVVFPHAYALAPYTLCSVPTMITGLSPLDHGVIAHEDVLSDDAVTLAEALREKGYLTAGFSATPNNSRSKGFAQGYDVFREIWTEGPTKESRRAHFLARRVVEWLDSVADDARPLHLQVHMVPPHSPYDPPEYFDVFTDPAYDGWCDGYNRTLLKIDGREAPATTECIEYLLDLYDGNLKTADDATRIIIEALQDRPRWKDTVVLITSDHGEAFWEHGWLLHNTTVHNEMLHVPFVLRLPLSNRDRSIETERLVTLADIVPTLLGTAGITVNGQTGIDLLSPTARTPGRYVVTRTTGKRPWWGLRTLSRSVMLNSAGSGALFDLSTDPGELDSTWAIERETAIGLGRILSRRIGLPPRLTVATESAEITEDERDMLETLGYVND